MSTAHSIQLSLNEGSFVVGLNVQQSNRTSVRADVPKVSFYEPALLLLYINGLPQVYGTEY